VFALAGVEITARDDDSRPASAVGDEIESPAGNQTFGDNKCTQHRHPHRPAIPMAWDVISKLPPAPCPLNQNWSANPSALATGYAYCQAQTTIVTMVNGQANYLVVPLNKFTDGSRSTTAVAWQQASAPASDPFPPTKLTLRTNVHESHSKGTYMWNDKHSSRGSRVAGGRNSHYTQHLHDSQQAKYPVRVPDHYHDIQQYNYGQSTGRVPVAHRQPGVPDGLYRYGQETFMLASPPYQGQGVQNNMSAYGQFTQAPIRITPPYKPHGVDYLAQEFQSVGIAPPDVQPYLTPDVEGTNNLVSRGEEACTATPLDRNTNNQGSFRGEVSNPMPRQYREPFRPSRLLSGQPAQISPKMAQHIHSTGTKLNPNYLSEVTPTVIAQRYTPWNENCAIRIEDIPASATLREVFATIQEGKVFQFVYIPPNPSKGHYDAAARLVFATRKAAENFVSRSTSLPGIFVKNQRLYIIWNRDRSPGLAPNNQGQSRVIRIVGPKHAFSMKMVEDFLHQNVKFDLVDRYEEVRHHKRTVELHFQSILGQSRSAMRCISEFFEDNGMRGLYNAFFAGDPCDVAANLARREDQEGRTTLSQTSLVALQDK
jgi:hypothetical protein